MAIFEAEEYKGLYFDFFVTSYGRIMAKQSFEDKLARLKHLEKGALSEDAAREIRHALAGSSSVLAARAARAAAKLNLRDLAPEIVAAFNRYMQNPAKTDPGCHAKTAAVEALNELDFPEADALLRGIHHVQMEPSYGPPVDTADLLRAACAFGLYRLGHRDLLYEIVTLLMDSQPAPRRAAIKVLVELSRETSEMLLRLKALQGDKESEVLGDCFSGLMTIDPSRSLKFVGQFLSADNPEIAEEAALAIGGARLREGFILLRDCRERSILPTIKRMLLLPIALTRCEEAFDLLLGVVQNEHPDNAAAAIEALSIYSANAESREKISDAVSMRSDPLISKAYQKEIAGSAP
jgi:hypothetical protein